MSTQPYQGKIVLITGGAGGIGRELCLGYASLGATVLVADKDYEGERFFTQEILPLSPESAFFHVELASVKGCEQLMESVFARYSHLDILINAAACTRFSVLAETTAEDWDYILSTNLRAPFLLCKAFAAQRENTDRKDDYGRVIHLASTRAMMSEEGTECYSASKGGLVSLTHALAVSLSAHNLTVNCISPGWICCEGYEDLEYSDHRQHPSGRVGRPVDVLKACLYLTDEGNNFINGQNLVLDGGMTKKMIYLS